MAGSIRQQRSEGDTPVSFCGHCRPMSPQLKISAEKRDEYAREKLKKRDEWVRKQLKKPVPCPICNTPASLSDTIIGARESYLQFIYEWDFGRDERRTGKPAKPAAVDYNDADWNCTCHVCDTKLAYAMYGFGPPRLDVRAGTAVHYDPKETN